MTPKEKARELYDKYWLIVDTKSVKKCALIAVDEIIRVCPYFDLKIRETDDQLSAFDFQFVSYWQKVIQEIKIITKTKNQNQMKNIHVLPTDKEPVKGDLLLRHIWKDTSNECISWWRYDDTITIDGVVQYTTLNGSFRDITSSFKVQNIYITSDEEIKEGDWCYDLDTKYVKIKQSWENSHLEFNAKKIILTTDQDLIKDGVQAVDDEFLEWFVKNPSCESVGVEKYHGINTSIAEVNAICGDGSLNWQDKSDLRDYKIIIPKEEAKQDLEKEMFELEQELNIPSNLRWHNSKPKQETLEEATFTAGEESFKEFKKAILEANRFDFVCGFTEGAKWQQERMYSEEEVLIIITELKSFLSFGDEFNEIEWLKKIKNK